LIAIDRRRKPTFRSLCLFPENERKGREDREKKIEKKIALQLAAELEYFSLALQAMLEPERQIALERRQEPGARSQEPGARSQEPGARSQEPGAWKNTLGSPARGTYLA
jgi:hypothetical protein